MNKYGPTRSELKTRLAISIAGLALMIGGLLYRGLPTGIGGWEAVVIATLFFGGTTLWTLKKLIRREHPDGL
ncbi:MAG: hypothetical protein AAFN94_06195 [Pseudomonadota bacterium]